MIFSNRYGVSKEELTEDSLITDLCTDSLEILELLMYIEDEFDMTFPDDVAQEFKTLGDIAEYLSRNVDEAVLAELRKKIEGKA